jgi:hypothetical protein
MGRVFERTSGESANVIVSDPYNFAAGTRSQKDATNDVSFLARTYRTLLLLTFRLVLVSSQWQQQRVGSHHNVWAVRHRNGVMVRAGKTKQLFWGLLCHASASRPRRRCSGSADHSRTGPEMMVRGIMAGSEESMLFHSHAAFGILVYMRDVFSWTDHKPSWLASMHMSCFTRAGDSCFPF